MNINSKGFGAIEIVLIIVAVAILGFVGYRTYVAYTDNYDPSGSALEKRQGKGVKKNEAEQTDDASNDGYIVVSDWGVRFPVISSSAVRYEFNNEYGGTKPEGYSAIHMQFAELDQYKGCKEDKSNAGILSRQRTKDNMPVHREEVAKINGYYYYYTASQAACSEQDYQTIWSKVQPELESAIKKLESIAN